MRSFRILCNFGGLGFWAEKVGAGSDRIGGCRVLALLRH